LSRIYRLSLNKKIEADEATKYAFMLRELRNCIESEPQLMSPEAFRSVEIRVLSIDSGKFFTHEAAALLAAGKLFVDDIEVDQPVTIDHEPQPAESDDAKIIHLPTSRSAPDVEPHDPDADNPSGSPDAA
jgi:hypothetical protein